MVQDKRYMVCPDLGHRWDVKSVERETEGLWRGSPKRTLICGNCMTERIDYLRSDGSLLSRRYKYEDYREQLRTYFGDRHDRVQRVRAVLIAATFDKPRIRRVK